MHMNGMIMLVVLAQLVIVLYITVSFFKWFPSEGDVKYRWIKYGPPIGSAEAFYGMSVEQVTPVVVGLTIFVSSVIIGSLVYQRRKQLDQP